MVFKKLAVVLGVVLTIIGTAAAQTGSITGQVFDPQGSVVANAQITATSDATGIVRTVTTSSAGLYSFAALPPAVYSVEVEAKGFQAETRENIVLNIAATLPVNFKLAVAGAAITVEVAGANSATVETDSFQLSTVIDSKQMTDLPLILRDPYQLVLLSPGTVFSANNEGGFSVNGQRDRNNNFMLDGADNNDTSVPGSIDGASSANPDSAQEFRVITNNFDAEYGRNTGAIIDVVTRGGSNQFHGDAYEFGRYNALGARDFFNTKANGPQDPYVRNDFGASIGGPAWKDHTFFFLNGEVQRFRTTRTGSQIVPTAAFKTGRFTYIDPSDGSRTPVDLTNPANPANQFGLPRDPTISRIYAATPLGQVDNGDGVSSTYFFPSPDNLNAYSLTGRFDQKLTNKHQLTVRYIYQHQAASDPFHDEVLPGYGNSSLITTNHNGVISIASVLSANTSNVFRSGFNLINAGFFCNHAAIDALTGIDSFGNGRDIAIPYFYGSSFGCVGLFDSNSQSRLSSTLTFADTMSIIKGAHSIKFGGDFRSVKDSNNPTFFSRDSLFLADYSLYGPLPNGVGDAYTFAGNPNSPNYAAFQDLIYGAQGAVGESTEDQFFTREGVRRGNDLSRFRQHEFSVFAQDTWKVNPKLALIAGLRYAFNGVPYEKDGNLSNLFTDASGPVPAIGYFAFTPVGPGTGHQLYANNWGMVEPRIGFSYDLGGEGKTAIRGGYGIFHDRIFDNLFGSANENPPFQSQQTLFPFDGTVASTVSNVPFPGNLPPVPGFGNGDFASATIINPHLKMPTSQTWNLGVQRQLRSGLTAEINYVGSHSTHGLRAVDGAPPQPALVQKLLAQGVPAASLQRTALYTSFPAVNNTAFFNAILETSVVNGSYNALQTKVVGQIGGLTLTGSYTYAHSLDNGSDPLAPGAGNSNLPRNSFDLSLEHGSSDFDVRHRGTVAATYNLPIGEGSYYLNRGLVGRIFEGIQISGIQQIQTGLPFDLRGTVDNLHTATNNRPQLIGAPYPSGRGKIVAQGKITGPSPAAFTNPAFGQNVSIHRNKFYGPGFVNTDVVFQKTQTVYKQAKVIFRAESYNVFNHPNLTAPGFGGQTDEITLGSPTFGISNTQLGQNDGTTGARQIQGAVKLVF